jgi:NAD(P)-dependent dehydrogenase (short-subunit alcohol dehydrogenase family)
MSIVAPECTSTVVSALAETVRTTKRRLDILVNNAGAFYDEKQNARTADLAIA